MIMYQEAELLLGAYQYRALKTLLNLPEEHFLSALLHIGELSLDFDFEEASRVFKPIRNEVDPELRDLLDRNFADLKAGKADSVFSELIHSMRIQIGQGQFTDFLGRVYRFNEAYFKYIFARKEFSGPIDVRNQVFEENKLMNRLRTKYRINTGNLIFGVEKYMRIKHKNDKALISALDKLTSPKMKAIIELRHESIVGHGFHPGSEHKIKEIFPKIEDLVELLVDALRAADLKIYDGKYRRLNAEILQEVKREYTSRTGPR